MRGPQKIKEKYKKNKSMNEWGKEFLTKLLDNDLVGASQPKMTWKN